MSEKGPQDLIPAKSLKVHILGRSKCQLRARTILDEVKNDKEFLEAESFRDQCTRLNVLYRQSCEKKVSYDILASIFADKTTRSSIQQQIVKAENTPRQNGRPPGLSKEECEECDEWLQTMLGNEDFPTWEDLEDHIFEKHKKAPTHAEIYDFLEKFSYESRIAEPMEEERVNFSKGELVRYLTQLNTFCQNVKHGFLFNVDEAGEQDYVDACKTYVIMPKKAHNTVPKIPVSRLARRMTVIHTVASDAQWIKPLFIVNRKTYDSEIHDYITEGMIDIQHQPKGFCNAPIFGHWLLNIFIPHLIEKRKSHNYYGPSLLLLDGFTAHHKITDYISPEKLKELNLTLLYLPPHTSDQIQPLDLGIFGIQKRKYGKLKKYLSKVPISDLSKQILSVYRSLWQSCDPLHVKSCFQAAGIVKSHDGNHIFTLEKALKLRIDMNKALENLIELDRTYLVRLLKEQQAHKSKRIEMKMIELKEIENKFIELGFIKQA